MDSGNPFAPLLNDWRREKAPQNINFCELPSCIFIPTMHTPLYPNCTWTMFSTVFTNNSIAMDKSQIVSSWFSRTSSTTHTVFTCSCFARLKGVIFRMDANPILNSLHPLPKWCGLSTPSPNISINWKWISRMEMFCLYKLCHTTKFSAWQSFHYHYHCT